MKFKGKKIDLTLELESESGEKRVFVARKKVCGAFSNEIAKACQEYDDKQSVLAKEERDIANVTWCKVLSWVYKDFDADWVITNFSQGEIKQIHNDVMETLADAKNEQRS